MSKDILHRLGTSNQNPDIQCSLNVSNEVLVVIEDMCLKIVNKALVQLDMPVLNHPYDKIHT